MSDLTEIKTFCIKGKTETSAQVNIALVTHTAQAM
jgi:hypothetical protein